MKKIYFLLLLSLLSAAPLFAKVNITVQGTVYGGNKNNVLIGAIVTDKSTNTTTTTDVDGQFIMTVEEDSKLEVKALGYAPKIVKVKSTYMDIVLSNKKGIGLSVKPYAQFDVLSNFYYNSILPEIDPGKTSGMKFGFDLGYTFLNKNNNTLEINVGLAYRKVKMTPSLSDFNYSYYSYPDGDIDWETYDRYYQISSMKQKVDLGLLTLPIYFSYAYHFGKRVSLHVDAGANINFRLTHKISKVEGWAYSYGVYPQYNDLLIDNPAYNGFGTTDLSYAYTDTMWTDDVSDISILTGVGVEVYVAGPLSVDVGARYNIGLTNLYPDYDPNPYYMYFSPVYYTNYMGHIVNSLTSYYSKSKLSQLSVRVALNLRF